MQPPFPCPTSTWRSDTYPEISPERPELSVKGKTVVITGANEMECCIHRASVTDAEEMKQAAERTGTWDVLIIAAAFLSTPGFIRGSDLDDWWQAFETNVKGTMIVSKAFSLTANASHAALIGITSATNSLPPIMLPTLSAYQSSKLAQAKVLEFVAAENPSMFVASVHPGIVRTLIFDKSGATEKGLPMDTVELAAHFTLWLASPEAAFLKSRLVWANWDVNDLRTIGSVYFESLRKGRPNP
ncbi:short chain dehydrogenase [Phlyctema vagabunda]|uniref:Short chain dehydrogenase n=1 Tax=Phlyctema vagabunda TaxID=108571 RepID=A0ABR4P8D6_9HELO